MANTYAINIVPNGASETSTVPLVKKNGTAVVGVQEIRFAAKKLQGPLLDVGPLTEAAAPAGAYAGFASLEFEVADANQAAITDNISQLSKIPGGGPGLGVTASATRTPVRTERAHPGDTIEFVDPAAGTVVMTFVVPGGAGSATYNTQDSGITQP